MAQKQAKSLPSAGIRQSESTQNQARRKRLTLSNSIKGQSCSDKPPAPHFWYRFPIGNRANARMRTHTRTNKTKRNDFQVGLTNQPPVSPPNFSKKHGSPECHKRPGKKVTNYTNLTLTRFFASNIINNDPNKEVPKRFQNVPSDFKMIPVRSQNDTKTIVVPIVPFWSCLFSNLVPIRPGSKDTNYTHLTPTRFSCIRHY